MVKSLWELVKSCGLLSQSHVGDENHYKSKDCEWRVDIKTTTTASVQVLSGVLRCLVLSDIHSPFFYPPAVSLAIAIGKLLNPHLVILNGDIIDCFSVSPFRRASRKENLTGEIETTRELLDIIVRAFPKTPFIYIEGNHEFFLQKYIGSRATALADLEALKIPNLLNFKGKGKYYLCRKEEYSTYSETAIPTLYFCDSQNQLQLVVIHGDGMNISRGAVHYARLILQRTLVNTVCAHWHVSQTWQVHTLHGKRIGAWVFPPLCFPRPHWRNSIWGLGVGMFTLSHDGLLTVDIIDFVPDHERKLLVAKYGNKILTEDLGDENILFE